MPQKRTVAILKLTSDNVASTVNMAMARGGPTMGGGGAGAGYAGAAGGFAAAGAALYAATQAGRGHGHSHGDGEPGCGADVDEAKNKSKLGKFLFFSFLLMFGSYAIIQGFIESQHGMFEFMGVDAAPEEYKRRVIELYEVYNPAKLEGEDHRRPVDDLFWKYRYKPSGYKKLWLKIKKKYDGKPTAQDQEEEGATAHAKPATVGATESSENSAEPKPEKKDL